MRGKISPKTRNRNFGITWRHVGDDPTGPRVCLALFSFTSSSAASITMTMSGWVWVWVWVCWAPNKNKKELSEAMQGKKKGELKRKPLSGGWGCVGVGVGTKFSVFVYCSPLFPGRRSLCRPSPLYSISITIRPFFHGIILLCENCI